MSFIRVNNNNTDSNSTNKTKPRVAILGSGPSGLVSAKSALESGLEPFVFEKANTLGGLWRPDTGATWPSMRTNLSHFSCMFSDFPWETITDDFPTQTEMYHYLCRYAKHFDIEKYIHYNSNVISVNKNAQNQWHIQWVESDGVKAEDFDFVMVATGIFSKPYIPEFKGLDKFQKTKKVLHSSEFKTSEIFKGQQVVTIGGAFSGAEIAANIASDAKQVINVINNPFWVLPRRIPKNADEPKNLLPSDLVFYTRKPRPRKPATANSTFTINQYFKDITGNDQSEFSDALRMDLTSNNPARVIISDTYLSEVKAKHIDVRKGKIKEFDENGIIFEDGSRIDADAVVFSTGYQLNMPFFDKTILDQLDYLQEDQLQPMLLYKCTFHPDLPNLGFIGMYRGPFFTVMELQARWASMVFNQEIPLPSRETMLKGIGEELAIRKQQPRPQFPHGNYVQFADSLAKEINVLPDIKALKQENPEWYKILWKGPVVPSHYRFFGAHKNPEVAFEQSNLAFKTVEGIGNEVGKELGF